MTPLVLHIESLLGVLDEGGLCPALFLLAMEDLVLGIVEDLDSFEATLAIEHLIFVCPLALVAVVSLLLQRNHRLFESDSYKSWRCYEVVPPFAQLNLVNNMFQKEMRTLLQKILHNIIIRVLDVVSPCDGIFYLSLPRGRPEQP